MTAALATGLMRRGDVVETEHGVPVLLGTPMPRGWWRGRALTGPRIEDGVAYVVNEQDVRRLFRPTGWG